MSEQEQEPKKEEWAGVDVEGERWFWYYVCEECHGMVVWKQEYCLNCKRRLDWDGKIVHSRRMG